MLALLRPFCLSAVLIPALTVPLAFAQSPTVVTAGTSQLQSLPLTFESSISARNEYLIRSGAMIAKVGPTELQIALPAAKGTSELLSVQLGNASAKAEPTVSEKQSGDANYLIGNMSEWRTHVSRYGRLTYANVYSGIDLTYYGNGSRLEHDFIVQPGADPATIDMRFRGSRKAHLLPNGDLLLSLDKSAVTLHKPVAYQSRDGVRSDIPVQFALSGDNVRFSVGSYDHSQPLVIDPVITLATYLAGTGADTVTAVATDAGGNIIVTGYTNSTDFPTKNPLQSGVGGSGVKNAFVTKLDPTGKTLIYSTYLGGSSPTQGDFGGAIAIDSAGNAIVAGTSSSSDFPHVGSVPPVSTCQYTSSCYFIASLKPDGSALNYSGRIGGLQGNYTNGVNGRVAVDASGNAYLAGLTDDIGFYVTPGTFGGSPVGYPSSQMFVMKVNPTGNVVYSTIVPGNAATSPSQPFTNAFLPTGISVDSSGRATVLAWGGPGLPTTPGVVGAQFPNSYPNVSDSSAGVVLRLNATATALDFASYLPGTDQAGGLAIDSNGNLWIAGTTNETNLPVSTNAYQKTLSVGAVSNTANGSGYIMELAPGATSILAATYLDGTGVGQNYESSSFSAISLDSQSNVFVGGTTSSPDFPMKNPFATVLSTAGTIWGMVLAEMSPDLSTLKFGSFLNATGPSSYEGSNFGAMTLDAQDNLIAAGTTFATDFPTTTGSVQPTPPTPASPYTSYLHSFVAKIDMSIAAPAVCFDKRGIGFGSVNANTSSSISVQVTNCGNAPLNINAIISDAPTVTATQSCSPVAPGAVCPIQVTFTPVSSAGTSGTLTFSTNAATLPQKVTFNGQGIAPSIFPVTNPVSFGHYLVGTLSTNGGLLLQNKGQVALIISSVSVSGSAFAVASQTCTGRSIAANSYCSVALSFTPPTAGVLSGTVTVASNDPQTPQLVVDITGTGDAVYATPTLSSISVPTTLVNTAVTENLTGANFYPQSVVQLNGAPVTTKFLSNTLLQVTIPVGAITALGEQGLTVVNPAPGGTSSTVAITPYSVIPLTLSNMVYDATSKKIFAAVPNLSTTNPNTILPIDPATGSTGTPIPVLNNPTNLAVSDDGRYLYVSPFAQNGVTGQLQRIDLTTGSVDRTFTLPGSSTGIREMHVVPGYPELLVATLTINASPSENGVALFNDAGLVEYHSNGYGSPGWSLDSFQFVGQTFYAPYGGGFSNYAVLPTGFVSLNPPSCCTGATGSVTTDGSQLYTSTGQVWDPRTSRLIGTYSVPVYPNSFYADAVIKRTFFMSNFVPNVSGTTMLSYDSSTLQSAGSLSFGSVGGGYWLMHSTGDYFAFGNNLTGGSFTDPSYTTNLILFRSSLGAPGTPTGPTIVSTSPSNLPASSPATTVTLTGSGFDADAVVSWNGSPRVTTYTSATSLQVQLTADDLNTAGIGKLSVKNAGTGLTGANFNFQMIGAPITFSPASLTFPAQAVNSTSAQQAITLTNTSGADIHDLTLAVTGTDATLFKQKNNCLATLISGASCTASVTFTSSSTGTKSASLIVNQAGVALPATAALSGKGSTPGFTLSKTVTNFDTFGVGLYKQIVVAYITNTGEIPITNVKASISGTNSADFTGSTSCYDVSLGVGLQCLAFVSFQPQAIGARTATLTISADGAASQQLTLTGTGVRTGLSTSATTFAFGDIVVGDTRSATTTFTNTGEATLDMLQVVFDSLDRSASQFSYNTTCAQSSNSSYWSLAPGQSCTFTLILAPSRLGALSNALTFGVIMQTGDGSMPAIQAPMRQRITYTMNGIDAFGLGATSVDSGNVIAGQGSSEKTISLIAANGFAFGLNGTLSGTDASEFNYSNDCPTSITAATSCTLHIKFTPTTVGAKTAILTLVPQRSSPQTTYPFGLIAPLPRVIMLTGTGSDFNISGGSGGSGGSAGTPAATVTAGQPAAYSLSVSQSVGSQDIVTMSCGNLPQYATCTFTPPSFTLGSAPTVVNLSISTQQTATSSAIPLNGLRVALSLALLGGWGLWAAARRRSGLERLLQIGLVLLSVGLIFTAGCAGAGSGSSSNGGSGSSGGGTGGSGGGTGGSGGGTGGSGGGTGGSGGGTGGGTTVNMTPAGTYSVAVTATTGSISRSQNVTLTVK
ncbi:choice-of-anchor D domain-containing protein [Terriglobus sp. TAA 43]|uniref:choice-of-anchor D domain-containing protein n=1 Tax=Terriglobus sp. TAA 43 TaxID=278961 RepID=UPI000645CCBF|nr:choice-of-anchor D domain-containing protein [Terriglobus sp. TAA 43]